MRAAPSLLVLFAIGCGNDHAAEPPDPGAEPVYYGEVDRILDANCVECHSNDPDRLAPFSLEGYDAAAAAAETAGIAFAVMNRAMPPYYAKNDGTCQTFHDTKWLTDDEIDTLVRWSNGAHLAGDPQPAPPRPTQAELPQVDHTLDIGADYLPKGPADDYRCFVIDPASPTDQFLTGVHVRPGNATVVHHVIVFTLNDAAAQTAIEAADAADPGPGYECTGGAGDGTNFLTGWAPGGAATLFPPDTGLLVPGGRKLVIQMHYNSQNANGLPDRTQVDLDLAASVKKRAAIIGVRADVDLPPREVDVTAVGSLALNVQNVASARVWGGAIHMHTRGIAADVHVQQASDTCLLDLANWDFHWQHFYWYQQPVTVNRGDTLKVTCHYDTSDDTQRVTWGEKTTDEMCIAYLYISL